MILALSLRIAVACSLLLMFGASKLIVEVESREKRPIQYQTINREDPNLKEGKSKVIKKGKTGRKLVVFRVTRFFINGREINRKVVSSEVLSKPHSQVLAIGTLINVREIEDVSFTTEYVREAGLAAGTSYVKQKGVNGKKEMVFEVGYESGREVLRRLKGETITIEPVTQIIALGPNRTPMSELNIEGLPSVFEWTLPEDRQQTLYDYLAKEIEEQPRFDEPLINPPPNQFYSRQ